MKKDNGIGINDFILECWGVDDAGWRFKLVSDEREWWEVLAVSETLGEFRAQSWLFNDVEETLYGLLNKIRQTKELSDANAGND